MVAVLHSSRSCALKHPPHIPGTNLVLMALAGLRLVSCSAVPDFLVNIVDESVEV